MAFTMHTIKMVGFTVSLKLLGRHPLQSYVCVILVSFGLVLNFFKFFFVLDSLG